MDWCLHVKTTVIIHYLLYLQYLFHNRITFYYFTDFFWKRFNNQRSAFTSLKKDTQKTHQCIVKYRTLKVGVRPVKILSVSRSDNYLIVFVPFILATTSKKCLLSCGRGISSLTCQSLGNRGRRWAHVCGRWWIALFLWMHYAVPKVSNKININDQNVKKLSNFN